MYSTSFTCTCIQEENYFKICLFLLVFRQNDKPKQTHSNTNQHPTNPTSSNLNPKTRNNSILDPNITTKQKFDVHFK